MAMFFQTTNTGKRGGRWAVEKAGPWKARKTKSRFSSLPTALGNPAKTAGFPLFPQPRLLAISQTTSGNLIVVDRKECLTPDTSPRFHSDVLRRTHCGWGCARNFRRPVHAPHSHAR